MSFESDSKQIDGTWYWPETQTRPIGFDRSGGYEFEFLSFVDAVTTFHNSLSDSARCGLRRGDDSRLTWTAHTPP